MTAAPWRPRSHPQADPPLNLQVVFAEGTPPARAESTMFAVWLVTGDSYHEVCQTLLEIEEAAEKARKERIAMIEEEIKELEAKRAELAGIRGPRRKDEKGKVSI